MRYLLSLIIVSVFLLTSASPVNAIWTFDAFNPIATVGEDSAATAAPSDSVNILLRIGDNNTLTPTTSNKRYYLVVQDNSTPPTSLPSRNCSSILIKRTDLPCKYEILPSSTTSITVGPTPPPSAAPLKSTVDVKTRIGPFSANNTHYIFGRINHDDAGNTGLWSSAYTFLPTPPAKDPFIQTERGDVHTNEGITNPGGR